MKPVLVLSVMGILSALVATSGPQGAAAHEKGHVIAGVIKEIKGESVVLDGNRVFKVNQDTVYFKETGLDLIKVKFSSLTPGTSVYATLTSANVDGVAVQVVINLFNVQEVKPVQPAAIQPKGLPFAERFCDESEILSISREPKPYKEVKLSEAIMVLTTYRKVTELQYGAYAHKAGTQGTVGLKNGKSHAWHIEPGYAATVQEAGGATIYLLHPDLNIVPSPPNKDK